MTGEANNEPLTELRAMLAATPHDGRLRLRVAHALLGVSAANAAEEVLAPLLTSKDESIWAEAVSRMAHIHEQRGENSAAAVLWEQLLAVNVDHPEARAHLARIRRNTVPVVPARRRTDATLLSPEGVVAARYEILSELGRGGTSTVFLARDSHLDLRIALKVLHPFLGAAARSEVRQRFFREARLAAALRHPGVVAVYDLDENTRSLAMEYLPLGTLRHRLSQGSAESQDARLPVQEIESLTRDLLTTLVHVHAKGLVHGDLKPRNILLRDGGYPVLGDFGVARLATVDANERDSAGTPLYLAPEQLRGSASSIRTDLFAMGAMIWEMAAGRPMRTRADLTSGRFAAPPLPPEAAAYLQAGRLRLERIVRHLTQENPLNRPESAAQVLQLME